MTCKDQVPRLLADACAWMSFVGLCLACSQIPLAAQNPSPFVLSSLPPPPPAIAELIKAGQVTFEAGERQSRAEPPTGPRIIAETQYKIAYNFNSRTRWKVDRSRRRVVITIRFRDIRWQPTHRIWFQNKPATADFWKDRLVLHEFDHVRISTDPRVGERFRSILRNKGSITSVLSRGDVVNREFVDRIVESYVSEVFSEVSDLVAIRYKELDRVTSHGQDDLPPDSSLASLLRPGPKESKRER